MPRSSRLDAPGVLHHVMGRGIDRKEIFIDNKDREDFITRLAAISTASPFVPAMGPISSIRLCVRSTAPVKNCLSIMPCKQYKFMAEERYLLLEVPSCREKLSSLSEFIREIKVGFARYYHRPHNRRGYFWGDRFKSVIVDKGETLAVLIFPIFCYAAAVGLLISVRARSSNKKNAPVLLKPNSTVKSVINTTGFTARF